MCYNTLMNLQAIFVANITGFLLISQYITFIERRKK